MGRVGGVGLWEGFGGQLGCPVGFGELGDPQLDLNDPVKEGSRSSLRDPAESNTLGVTPRCYSWPPPDEFWGKKIAPFIFSAALTPLWTQEEGLSHTVWIDHFTIPFFTSPHPIC